ncbi:TraR/DksA family transcriptional regulator [Thermoleophilia bacterium SCSIO 60948]|nr:TraR/DksA family transcriptional regulator [Thermoleophilia bacterium SCSIO 60948]
MNARDDIDLEAIRAHLEARLDELGGRIDEAVRPPDAQSGISFGKRIGDGTTEAVDRFVRVGVAEQLDESGKQVARALEKLDEGSYGTCDNCGAEIPAGRLQARPESVLCVECAAA